MRRRGGSGAITVNGIFQEEAMFAPLALGFMLALRRPDAGRDAARRRGRKHHDLRGCTDGQAAGLALICRGLAPRVYQYRVFAFQGRISNVAAEAAKQGLAFASLMRRLGES